ncbi:S-adenosyl-L-methionine-dependent methyltransferase [Leptospira bourretii]|uniref:S-adenosyl-L-methionine-dependent methyltransferase n=1 Tax=Leptospira bourretii TaxID=2484962 RepID=A0A4R9IMC6_9LEPT|nr:tRNA (5-methylaminomethyl-2-thiouridine)(34)-methyltransferase MnmD [Leptospira bourretii]TGK85368.1 S-adenosyl-L-methionine-dependent methyltransferase [Leptospira bourretii]TGK91128.1 S-adenosyl-L-methionine-dependent methyltransferase [Leptospira bourretii]TGL30697.1 S-adenosyl-L-methionine-dependent methyltransferase [Leptospira bourretii]
MEPVNPRNNLKNPIEFKDGVPVSLLFDDVYFSKEGGWEESNYVFLEGNRVTAKLEKTEKSKFRVGELGFGSGLNLFVTLEIWKSLDHPRPTEFISLEGYPLPKEILLSLNNSYPKKELWFDELILSYEKALEIWQIDNSRNLWTYRWEHSNLRSHFDLKVFFGDIKHCLPQFPEIDVWYMDGFSPGKNPDMWSQESLRLLKTKSIPGTSFATFSSAGFLRRGLAELGFVVEKKKGFGRKREMISGYLESTK